jgi:hypothetical protein
MANARTPAAGVRTLARSPYQEHEGSFMSTRNRIAISGSIRAETAGRHRTLNRRRKISGNFLSTRSWAFYRKHHIILRAKLVKAKHKK